VVSHLLVPSVIINECVFVVIEDEDSFKKEKINTISTNATHVIYDTSATNGTTAINGTNATNSTTDISITITVIESQ